MYNFAFNVKLSFRLINNANLFCLIIISNSYRYIHIGRTRDIRKRAFQIYFLLSNGQSLNMQILKIIVNYRSPVRRTKLFYHILHITTKERTRLLTFLCNILLIYNHFINIDIVDVEQAISDMQLSCSSIKKYSLSLQHRC